MTFGWLAFQICPATMMDRLEKIEAETMCSPDWPPSQPPRTEAQHFTF